MLLSAIITDLAEKQGLKEDHVMSDGMKNKIRVAKSLVRSASTFIGSVSRNVTSATVTLLTGLTAVLAPQPHPVTNDLVSARDFSKVLGLNRKAKYFGAGLHYRDEYNNFLDLTGDIEIGESVTCRGCNGTLIGRGADGSYTVKLLPWGTEVSYATISAAQLR